MAGQEPRQRGQYNPVGRLQGRAMHLPAKHHHLVAYHQQFHVLGCAIAGELSQHLQHLA